MSKHFGGFLVSTITRQPFSCFKWPLKHIFHNIEKTELQEKDRKVAIILDAKTQVAKFAGISAHFTCFHGKQATIFFLKMALFS